VGRSIDMDNFFTRDEAVEIISDAEDEIKELKEQNKKLIEAVKEYILAIEENYCDEIFEDPDAKKYLDKREKLLSIISEIKGGR
jgi:hypothetical protein